MSKDFLNKGSFSGSPIEDIVTFALETMVPSGGDDLRGFAIDADFALEEQSDVFDSAMTTIGEDRRSALHGKILIKESVRTIHDVSEALLRAWPKIAYPDFQASSIEHFIEGTVFRFVTAAARRQLCVTGTFIATSAHHGKLVVSRNTDFASLAASIGAMPGGLPDWAA